jgi:hypothetical protein
VNRFFVYAAVLAPVAAAVTLAASFVAFRTIDLSFSAFAGLVVAPLMQAAALALADAPPAGAARAAGRVARAPLAQPPLVIDAILLGGGVIFWHARLVGFGSASTIQPVWIAAKAAVAGVLLIARWRGDPSRVALAAAAVVAAAAIFVPWHDRTLTAVAASLHLPGIAARVLVDGAAIAVPMALMLACARRSDDGAPDAALLMRGAAAALVGAGALDALAAFEHREIVQPWLGALTAAVSVAASLTFLAALMPEER